MTDLPLLAGSLAALLFCVEVALRGAESLAIRMRIPQAVIGLTIVALGTDLPELAITVQGSLQTRAGTNMSDLILGNAIGSSMAQLTLIGGITALSGGLRELKGKFVLVSWMLVLSVVALFTAVFAGTMGLTAGLLLLGCYVASLWVAAEREQESAPRAARHPVASAGLLLAGMAGILFFSEITLDSAVHFAARAGVSEASVGLFILGPGSSLPELMVSLWAAIRRMPALSLGNIAGSNLFDTLAIPGIAALISPLTFEPAPFLLDLLFLGGASVFLALLLMARRGMGRVAGAAMLGLYFVFIFYHAGAQLR